VVISFINSVYAYISVILADPYILDRNMMLFIFRNHCLFSNLLQNQTYTSFDFI